MERKNAKINTKHISFQFQGIFAVCFLITLQKSMLLIPIKITGRGSEEIGTVQYVLISCRTGGHTYGKKKRQEAYSKRFWEIAKGLKESGASGNFRRRIAVEASCSKSEV